MNGRVWKTLTAARVLRARRRAAADRARRVPGSGRAASMWSSSKAPAASSELNLREHDLVNLGLVTRIRAPWMLVADIERGGVFASVVGTAHLLTPRSGRCFAASRSTSSAATCRCSTKACGMLEERDGVALLRRVPVRRRHAAGRRGQPGAEDAGRERRRHRARASRSSGFRTCRTRPTSGC